MTVALVHQLVSAAAWRYTSATPNVARTKATARSSLDRSAIRRAASLTLIARSSAASTPFGIPVGLVACILEQIRGCDVSSSRSSRCRRIPFSQSLKLYPRVQ